MFILDWEQNKKKLKTVILLVFLVPPPLSGWATKKSFLRLPLLKMAKTVIF